MFYFICALYDFENARRADNLFISTNSYVTISEFYNTADRLV